MAFCRNSSVIVLVQACLLACVLANKQELNDEKWVDDRKLHSRHEARPSMSGAGKSLTNSHIPLPTTEPQGQQGSSDTDQPADGHKQHHHGHTQQVSKLAQTSHHAKKVIRHQHRSDDQVSDSIDDGQWHVVPSTKTAKQIESTAGAIGDADLSGVPDTSDSTGASDGDTSDTDDSDSTGDDHWLAHQMGQHQASNKAQSNANADASHHAAHKKGKTHALSGGQTKASDKYLHAVKAKKGPTHALSGGPTKASDKYLGAKASNTAKGDAIYDADLADDNKGKTFDDATSSAPAKASHTHLAAKASNEADGGQTKASDKHLHAVKAKKAQTRVQAVSNADDSDEDEAAADSESAGGSGREGPGEEIGNEALDADGDDVDGYAADSDGVAQASDSTGDVDRDAADDNGAAQDDADVAAKASGTAAAEDLAAADSDAAAMPSDTAEDTDAAAASSEAAGADGTAAHSHHRHRHKAESHTAETPSIAADFDSDGNKKVLSTDEAGGEASDAASGAVDDGLWHDVDAADKADEDQADEAHLHLLVSDAAADVSPKFSEEAQADDFNVQEAFHVVGANRVKHPRAQQRQEAESATTTQAPAKQSTTASSSSTTLGVIGGFHVPKQSVLASLPSGDDNQQLLRGSQFPVKKGHHKHHHHHKETTPAPDVSDDNSDGSDEQRDGRPSAVVKEDNSDGSDDGTPSASTSDSDSSYGNSDATTSDEQAAPADTRITSAADAKHISMDYKLRQKLLATAHAQKDKVSSKALHQKHHKHHKEKVPMVRREV